MSIGGVDGFEISGNKFYGLGRFDDIAIAIGSCRRGKVFDNEFHNGSGKIAIIGSADIEAKDNRQFIVPESPAVQLTGISEAAHSPFPIGSITSATIRLKYDIYGYFRGSLYKLYDGTRGYINNNEYTIGSIASGTNAGDTFTEATMTTTVSEPAPISVATTDITTGAGTSKITKTGHGLNNLACVHYIKGTTVVGGLTDAIEYWVIRVDANNFKLASSYANAVAATALDFTSTGTGTHHLYLVFVAWSYNNEFKDNNQTVTLAPNSTSVVRTTPITAGSLTPPTPMRVDIGRTSGGAVSGWGDEATTGVTATGGTVFDQTADTPDTTGETSPAPEAVYRHCRYELGAGTITVAITGLTPSATYSFRTHHWTSSGNISSSMTMKCTANGTEVFNQAMSFSVNGVYIQSFTVAADGSGNVSLVFEKVTTGAIVCGVEWS
jgi:hypothetical protein